MVNERQNGSFDWLALWILLSAWSSLSGWILSVVGCLNFAAILLSYAFFFGGVVLFRSQFRAEGRLTARRIFFPRRLAPRLWLVLTILALIGGLLYAPNNYDYLTYRFPRVLYWSWDHAWSWVPTVNERINYSGTGFEWLMVPLFVVFKTDRLFFLINFLSYLLLPGLVFSVFTRLGISRRISWWWMWVFPCGYCYILQAASTGNDSFAAIYLLASLHYLFEARGSSATRNLALSCLAIALTTGAKASNLPLGLPWIVLLFFQRNHFLGKVRPALVAMILLVSSAVSFLPMAALNIHFTGDFAGDPKNIGNMKVSDPVGGFLGNSLEMIKDNLSPPILPRQIDFGKMVPAFVKPTLKRGFPRYYLLAGELQIEEVAGVGMGVVLFTMLFIFTGVYARLAQPSLLTAGSRLGWWIVGAGIVAWLVYMTKMGSEATSRLIASYYPLLVASGLVLASLDGRIMRRAVFKWAAILVMLSAVPLVILSPARPLFPVQGVSEVMSASHSPPDIISRYNEVYTMYSARADAFAGIIAALPAEEQTIGLIQSGNDTEVSLWRPFGSRKVVEVTPADSAASMKAQGIHFVAVSQNGLLNRHQTTINAVLSQWSAKLVAQKDLVLMAHVGPETWYLVEL